MAYDVFISFKNTAPGGGLTLDRTIAERLHMKLRDEGLEVFFSEKDLSTAAFMDQIYQALDEAKVLILVGTSVEHINSEWVKSEWSTFFGAMKSGRKPDGHILTVLHGISTRDLPIQLEPFESFNANDLDGAVDFTFKTLGKVKKSEAAARIAEEQERQRKAAEEAALLEMQKRMEAERQAEREKAAAEKKRQKALAAAERERQKRLNAEKKAAEAQKRSEKQAGQNKLLKIVAAVLAAALILGGSYGVGAFVTQQRENARIAEELRIAEEERARQSAEPLTETDRELDKIFDFVWVGDGFAISCSSEDGGKHELPAEYNGYPVVEIQDFTFDVPSQSRDFLEIIVPNSVIRIGDNAFRDNKYLLSIAIPNSTTNIGAAAFSGCSNLTSITIPDSVTSIGKRAFFGCSSLTSITIPDSVTSIDVSTFSNCVNLTSITLPNSVTSIGNSAFFRCDKLSSITIPDSVTSIGSGAFFGCTITVTAPHEASYYGYTPSDGVTWVVE